MVAVCRDSVADVTTELARVECDVTPCFSSRNTTPRIQWQKPHRLPDTQQLPASCIFLSLTNVTLFWLYFYLPSSFLSPFFSSANKRQRESGLPQERASYFRHCFCDWNLGKKGSKIIDVKSTLQVQSGTNAPACCCISAWICTPFIPDFASPPYFTILENIQVVQRMSGYFLYECEEGMFSPWERRISGIKCHTHWVKRTRLVRPLQ